MHKEGNHAVCYLCLTSRGCPFEYAKVVTREMLRFLGLGVDLDISGIPVVCKTCSDNLQKCFDFKTVCIYTEDCINSFRNDRNKVNLDLSKIYFKKNENEDDLSKCHIVCRFCMEIAESGCYTSLSDETKDVMSAKAILKRYIPEINLDSIRNPVICISCNESLYRYFNFVKSCLDMENKIKVDCRIEESNNKPEEESKDVLQCAAENISNYENGYAEINITKNCDGNDLSDKIKLEFGNLAQRDFQQLHIKHEVNERKEDDGIKIENLNEVFEKYDENGENLETELKCENSVETENDGINIKREEIDIKVDEEDTTRFQDNVLTLNDALTLVTHQCKICKFQAMNKRGLKEHLLIHRNAYEVTMYSCDICTYQTKHKGTLRRHMLTHKDASEVTIYSCEKCTYRTKYKYCLKQHMLTHKNSSEVTMYSCENCTYQTKQKGVLRRHMLIHKDVSEVTMYSCEICTYQTKHKFYLGQHMLIHKNSSEVTMYSNENCTYQTKQKGDLRQRMLSHKDAPKVTMHSCEICTYQTKRKYYLGQHMLTHKNASEVTNYSCEICTFQTKHKRSVRQHMLSHKDTSEVTMYSCERCTYQTKHKGSLVQHMLSHKDVSEVTLYTCEKCTYQTKQKSNLKSHMIIHKYASEITMYSCGICIFKAKRKVHLRRHMLIHKNTP